MAAGVLQDNLMFATALCECIKESGHQAIAWQRGVYIYRFTHFTPEAVIAMLELERDTILMSTVPPDMSCHPGFWTQIRFDYGEPLLIERIVARIKWLKGQIIVAENKATVSGPASGSS